MSDLQRAIEIAVAAHRGQERKDGSPYVLHPLRLMFSVATPEAKVVAVLHDVVEDTDVSLDDLRAAGFSEEILAAIDCVTHESSLSYDDYIARIKGNPLAREVKLADLRDNANLFEIPELREKDLRRLEKYHRAYMTLLADEA